MLLSVGYVFLMLGILKQANNNYFLALQRIAPALFTPSVTVAIFLACCQMAYGQALPSSFYIKMPDGEGFIYGIHYLTLYGKLHLYLPLIIPFLILFYYLNFENLKRFSSLFYMIAAPLCIWLLYVIVIGGDFMEFRFLMPVLPLYFMVVFALCFTLLPKHQLRFFVVICALLWLGNMSHEARLQNSPGARFMPEQYATAVVESTGELNSWLNYPRTNWIIVGKRLGELFNHHSKDDVTIAVSASGAIPYYSNLPTVDVLGLNNKAVIAQHESNIKMPGHHVRATDKLLREQKTNLNINHPQYVCKQGNMLHWQQTFVMEYPFKRHQTLFLPLNNDCYVAADYIIPHKQIDEYIQKGVILRYQDVKRSTQCPPWLCL